MFTGNVSYVGEDWNDRTSSIQIRPWIIEDFEGIIQPNTYFYENANYEGKGFTVKGSTEYVGDELNDKVSSVNCDGECALLVFEHRDFGGQARLYDSSQLSLPQFNNKLSSALVLMDRICVTFYEHRDYKGDSRQDCSDLDVFPLEWNDRVSSLSVECDFCTVLLYQHRDHVGDHKAFRGKVPYIGDHWNDMISSVQIRPWKIENYEKKSEKSCVDPGEQKAYNVIQWIPIISTLYNIGASIGYAAAGCHSVARERAQDLALDLVMDLATIATGGAAGVAAYGIKTGVKGRDQSWLNGGTEGTDIGDQKHCEERTEVSHQSGNQRHHRKLEIGRKISRAQHQGYSSNNQINTHDTQNRSQKYRQRRKKD